jgi:hypothetical protein
LADAHVEVVEARLPSNFLERVIDAVAAGVKQQAAAFIATAPPLRRIGRRRASGV